MAHDDKTEKPTPQRLREARKNGDIPTSPEFTGATLALVGLVVLQQQAGHILDGLRALLAQDLATAGQARTLTSASVDAHLRGDVANGLLLLLPLVVTAVVGALVVGLLNTRGVIAAKKLKPSLRKLNPLSGAKHLVSKESLIMLLKAVMKIVIAVVIVRAWSPAWNGLTSSMPFMSTGDATATLWRDTLQAALQITAAFFVIGALDFGYRYFAWQKRLRMTKQEVKEEMQRAEGNPQVRARIRQQGRKRLRSLMSGGGLRRVPQADVVVTNPTHFAVAIQYQAGKMRAPKVIAKGQNLVALRIKAAAQEHNIPIVENKPLAQALFKSVRVNGEIPPELYHAVAQVLAFVYRMKQAAMSRQRLAVGSQPPRRGRPAMTAPARAGR